MALYFVQFGELYTYICIIRINKYAILYFFVYLISLSRENIEDLTISATRNDQF